MNKLPLLLILTCLTLPTRAQTVSDADGNTYNTVTIGTQTWMKEDLKTTKYNNATSIPEVTDSAAWIALTTPAYCWYNNDSATYKPMYGALYNWYTVNTGNLCPTGWHIPSKAEWMILINFLGGYNVAGGKMKSQSGWNFNGNGTNESGFTGLPGGNRVPDGSFVFVGEANGWWSDTTNGYESAWEFNLASQYNNSVDQNYYHMYLGLSVRCLKNSNTSSMNNTDKSVSPIIYPNPATNKLYVKNSEPFIIIAIYNMQGKLVLNKQTGSDFTDISNLAKGIYIVKIMDSINLLIKE